MLVQGTLPASVELEDYFVFQENNKKGIRNSKHKVVIPAMYDDLGWSIGEFLPVNNVVGYKENGRWGLITLKNKKVGPAEFNNLYPLNRELIAASKSQGAGEQYGIIGADGGAKSEFEFGRLTMFNNLIVTSKLTANNQISYGMINLNFQEVLPFKYSLIKTLNNKYALISSGEFSGLVSASGEVIIEPKYHEINLQGNICRGKLFSTYELRNAQNQLLASYQAREFRKAAPGIVVTSVQERSRILDTKGVVLATLKETQILDFEDRLAVIKRNGMYGVINSDGEEIIDANKKSVWIRGQYIGVEESDGHWKLLNAELQQVTSRNYQQITPATEGLFQVRRLDRWGFIDSNGEELIPPQYQETSPFEGGVTYAKYLGSWGLIDPKGNWLIKPRYDSLVKVNQNTYIFNRDNQYGLVKTDQAEVYLTSNRLYPAVTGAIEKNRDEQYGLISDDGEVMLSLQYKQLRPFDEDPRYYLFENEQGSGIFNITASTFFQDTTIQEMRTLNEGYIGIKINDQYGLIDLNGKLRIANRYEDIGVFNEDMLPIKIKGRWGYVDRIERLTVQPVYQSASHFVNGLAIVTQMGKSGLINPKGKIILKLDYDRLERLPEGLFICQQGKNTGLINADGRILLYPAYDNLEILENGNIKVQKNGKLGLVDKTGRILIPTRYDELSYDQYNDLFHLTKTSPWDEFKLQ
ncbi:MAG: hypothetical protein DHS20C17_32190 [Cyclobacteriaceae bacterium]|nr:MAG: hypothetical protein DHS20C17_32190 [Cyclobacteriaceae bacterium]